MGGLLRAIDDFECYPATKFALKIAPHVFVRPGELRHGEWNEIDWDKATWTIPEGKMKARRAHVVPLPEPGLQCVATGAPIGSVFNEQFDELGRALFFVARKASDQPAMLLQGRVD